MLSSCILPKTVQDDSSDCKTVTKNLTLEVMNYSGVYCHDHEQCLVEATLLLAANAVSGSIVIIGNTAHWLEKKARCSEVEDEKKSPDKENLSKELARR